MRDDEADQPSARGQLDSEAARWCSVMHGPDAERRRPAFEAWLRRGALHREAYNRMEEVFLLGAKLPSRLLDEAIRPAEAQAVRRKHVLPVAALLLLGVGAIPLLLRGADRDETRIALRDGHAQLLLSTMRVSSERFRLDDGSVVTLGPDSELAVDYGSASRRMRLARGRSRFVVAREPRPFVVEAGGGVITARGTTFEVAYATPRTVRVTMIEGDAEVAAPRGAGGAGMDAPRLLTAGQEASFGGPATISARTSAPERDAQPRTVGELVAAANRRAGDGPVLRVVDADLLDVALGGEFRVHDPGVVADRLALMLQLSIERTPTEIVVRRRSGR